MTYTEGMTFEEWLIAKYSTPNPTFFPRSEYVKMFEEEKAAATTTALETATAEQFAPDVEEFAFDPTQTGGTVLGIEQAYEGLQTQQNIIATEEEISAALTSSGVGQQIETLDLQRQQLETDKSDLEAEKEARRLETYWNGSYNARRWSDQDLNEEFQPKFNQIDVKISQVQQQIDGLKQQVRTSIEQAKQSKFKAERGKLQTGITGAREYLKGQQFKDVQRKAMKPIIDMGFSKWSAREATKDRNNDSLKIFG